MYVRSFADSNDDGIGDLPGITSRLDYVRRLGVDAIWLTPFYPSPQKDHGYDVAGYIDVNPEYGTLADFDRLVDRAHELGLKVLVDVVPNHTSDQHPWFQSALSSPDDPHRSWYYFADQKPDGSPPKLDVRLRRAGLEAGRGHWQVVPAPLRAGAAGPQLVESRSPLRVRTHHRVLAGARCGRLSNRRRVSPLQPPGPPRQAAPSQPPH